MIRIKVEVVPLGIESLAHTVGIATIINTGTGDPELGNYKALFQYGEKLQHNMKEIKYNKYPRKEKHVWHLISECLKKAIRNSKDEKFNNYDIDKI